MQTYVECLKIFWEVPLDWSVTFSIFRGSYVTERKIDRILLLISFLFLPNQFLLFLRNCEDIC